MKIRFLADANLSPLIGKSVVRQNFAIDFLLAQGTIPDSLPDDRVLALAAELNRVLVTKDVRTMSRHLARFVELQQSPGVLLVPSTLLRRAMSNG